MQLRLVGLKVNVSFCTTFALHRDCWCILPVLFMKMVIKRC